MILNTIFFCILICIYILFSAVVFFIIQNCFDNSTLNIITYILLLVFAYYFLCRIFLSFLLVAIDDSEPIKTSWRLMKGNVLKFSMLLALIIFSLFVVLFLFVLISSGIESLLGLAINVDSRNGLFFSLFFLLGCLFGFSLILFS